MSMLDRMEERHIARSLSDIAHREVSPSLDLWPSFQERLAARERETEVSPRRYGRMRRDSSKGPSAFALVAALIVMLIVVTPAAIPSVQAAVRERLQRFGLLLVEPASSIATATPVIPRPTPVQTPVIGTVQRHPWLSIAEAQQQAPFPIRVPAWVPERLTLRGAIASPGASSDKSAAPIIVQLSYGPANQSAGGLLIREVPGSDVDPYEVPARYVQSVLVNGQPALYVQGNWRNLDAANMRDDSQWDSSADQIVLSWVADSLTYTLEARGIGLTREEAIHIAASLGSSRI